MAAHSKHRAPKLRAQSASFREFELADPPTSMRARELWMQHAAGFILFKRVRDAGLATVDEDASEEVREAVLLAVDSTLYALMMQIDGVSGGLRSGELCVELDFAVELRKGEALLGRIDLAESDGTCTGFHQWKEGDFGEFAVVVPDASEDDSRSE